MTSTQDNEQRAFILGLAVGDVFKIEPQTAKVRSYFRGREVYIISIDESTTTAKIKFVDGKNIIRGVNTYNIPVNTLLDRRICKQVSKGDPIDIFLKMEDGEKLSGFNSHMQEGPPNADF